MALRKSITLAGTAQLALAGGKLVNLGNKEIQLDAYIKVVSVSGTKEEAVCSVLFMDGESTTTNEYEFQPSMDGGNFIQQAYLHLKTLPEFADATDC